MMKEKESDITEREECGTLAAPLEEEENKV